MEIMAHLEVLLRNAIDRELAALRPKIGVICQRYGTTGLPRAWDHRGALLRMLVGAVAVKSWAVSLSV